MRGMPKNPVTCAACGGPWGRPKDGLCAGCRNSQRRKYHWTPELDNELRRIYANTARSRTEMSATLRAFRNRLGWPRQAINDRAMRLSITTYQKYRWTPEQEAVLRELAGRKSVSFLVKSLRRGRQSIISKLWKMGLSGRCSAEGYSIKDLAELFGVSTHTVSRWIGRRWLTVKSSTHRISEASALRFLREHAEEYDLRRVDQAWFKGMIFPYFGYYAHGMGENASGRNPYEEVA